MNSRAKLRGKPLDKDCRYAITTTHEYGTNDNRVLCYGLYEDMSNWTVQEKCKECKAYFDNAEPLKGGME